jgi:hypothetical protein
MPTNQIREIQFQAGTDALVDYPGRPPGATGSFSVQLEPGAQQVGFVVRRAQSGRPATVPLTVVDVCGPWPTFVGMGANGSVAAPTGAQAAASPAVPAASPTVSPTNSPRPASKPSTSDQGPLAPPIWVEAETQAGATIVSWDLPPAAVRVRIFRAEYRPNPAPGSAPAGFEPLPPKPGVGIPNELGAAGGLPGDALLPGAFTQVGVSDTFFYQDRNIQAGTPYSYYVVAEDRSGTLSDPSNFVVSPSQAPPVTVDLVQSAVGELVDRGKLRRDRADSILRDLSGTRDARQRNDLAGARRSASSLRGQVARADAQTLDPLDAEDLQVLAAKLERRLRLGEARVLTP